MRYNMKRILMILMIVLAVVSVSAVSAADNATEIVKDDFDSQIEADESSDNVVLVNDSEEPVNKTPSKITSSAVSGYCRY